MRMVSAVFECRRGNQRGFTMMELLIGIAVLAILTTLALPAFTQFIANNRLASQANELVASLQFARSEALKRGVNVVICPSTNGSTCGGNWNEGWIAPDPANPATPLRVWDSPGDDLEFTPVSSSFTFQPSGFSATQQLEFKLSGCTSDSARRILVENTGRVASERVDCS